MTVALKSVTLEGSELDQVLDRHPAFPRLIAVKIDAQRRGVHYTERALETVDDSVQMRSPYLFGSRDGEIKELPESLLLRDGTTILTDPTPLAQNPYLVDLVDGKLALVDNGEFVEHVDLWPKPFYDFGRFHPSLFNPALIERICQIPNVVAVKAYLSDGLGKWVDVHHRVGDQVLLAAAEMAEWPITVAKYGQQWAGPADYVIFDQTAENPRIVRMFNLFAQGEFPKGMELYWELAPITLGARDAAFQCGMLGMTNAQLKLTDSWSQSA